MKKISCFIPNLCGGGAERAAINMLKGMQKRNISVDLVLASESGAYLNQVPKQIRIVNLGVGRTIKAILPLSDYLKKEKPDALVSHMGHANVVAVLAKELSRTGTKLVLVEQNTVSQEKSPLFRGRFVPLFMKWLYPRANAVVGVSKGVAEDLERQLVLPTGSVSVIYNPVVGDELAAKAKTSLDHPWFQAGSPPVFLAVGRLTEQKDFPTLIEAFALLRKERLARLLILGEGESRLELEKKINLLGIAEDVSLPGFVDNPFAYMHHANAFVLSSRWEGLPTVLIEAMACTCPVVSTDCPSGPNEILEAGKYGILVPVGDVEKLAKGMQEVLDNPPEKEMLMRRSEMFTVNSSVDKYLTVIG